MIIYNTDLHISAAMTAYIVAPVPMRVSAIRLCSTALAADGSAYYTITIANGSDTVASRTTDSGSSGTDLVADAVENLTLSNQDKLFLDAGDKLKITVAKASSPAAISVNLNFYCHAERDYS
jgi:hypothetical protein